MSKFFLLLASFASLATFACATPRHNIFVEYSLRDEAASAIDAWNSALALECPEVGFSWVSDRDSADVVVHWGDAPGELAGAETDGDIVIEASKMRDETHTIAVIAHELGHALDLPDGWHSSNPDDLMFAPVSKYRGPEPTAADVRAVCEAWGFS